jgi:type VII secretion protein EccB
MARQPTTWLHVSGYRFLLRRMEHALVRGDVRMLDDPLRAQSLSFTAGCVLAVVVIAVCAVLGILRPHGALGDAPIVMSRESGALYVRIGDSLHPVLNLASARLVAGTPANPEVVGEPAINGAKRGPLVGIPGAPATIAAPLDAGESRWTLCEHDSSTTVYVGADLDQLLPGRILLVTPRSESASTTYLLYGGWRAEVDLRNQAVVRSMQLSGVEPQKVSRATLDALPEMPAITVPYVPDAGTPGPLTLRAFPVGTVMRVRRAAGPEYYVVLRDGIQRIGEVAADLIRFTNPQSGRDIVDVAPHVIGSVPTVDTLPVATYPERPGVADEGVSCVRWTPDADGEVTHAEVLVAGSLPLGAGAPVTLAQADGEGPNIDSVVVPGGRSVYVRAVGVTGVGQDTGALYLVSDSGAVFGIRDGEAAKQLGLATSPVPAPWPVLSQLPRGPELSNDAASIVRDAVGAPA